MLDQLRLSFPKLRPVSYSYVGGGSIASAGRVVFADDSVCFVKRYADPLPAEAEKAGLTALAAVGKVRVPKVIDSGGGFLLLEWIEPGRGKGNQESALGRALARHHLTAVGEAFGFETDNFIGATPQFNTPATDKARTDWPEFFGQNRIMPQAKMALNAGLITTDIFKKCEALSNRLPGLLPAGKPCLLHGDLWAGNWLTSAIGEPALIDPGVYRGHPEADLAMTRMFGGFDPDFYRAYFEINPAQPGQEERVPLLNLYHYLNHLNLFGQSYQNTVTSILNRYT